MSPIIRNFIAKKIFQKKGVIANRKSVDFSANALEQRLKNAGINPNDIRSENELNQILSFVKQAEDAAFDQRYRVIAADTLEGKGITEKLLGKRGEVVDMTGKKINKNQGIMGGKSVTELMESGQVQKGTEGLKPSKKVQDREMFEGANKRLRGPVKEKQDMGPFGKLDVEIDYSASLNRPEFFDPKALNMYKETVKTGPEFFKAQKEQILNLINRKKSNMVPPTHSNYKLLKKSLQDQEDALEAIKVTEDLGGNENMFDFLRTKNIADYKAKPLQRSNYTKTDAEIKAEIEAGNKKGIESLKNKLDDPEDMADGGVAGLLGERPGYAGGNGVADEDAEKARLGKRVRELMDDGYDFAEAVKEAMKEGYAEGGIARSNFAMGKRAFLKLMGGIGAGIAGLKSGLLGLGGKQATKQVAKEIVTTPSAAGKPAWFDALVTRVVNEGDDVTKKFATKDREIVHATKIDDDAMVTVYRDLDNGTVRVDIDDATKNVMDDQGNAIVSLEVKSGKSLADETTGKKIPKNEFEAVETDYRNYMDGPDDYTTEIVENAVSDTKDLTADLTKVKLFAKGQKKPTINEIMIQKDRAKRLKQAEEKPAEYAADRGPDIDTKDYDYATGGRIGLFLGGGLTAGKGLLKNMLKFMAKDGSHKKSPAEVLQMMNPKQYQKLLNDPRYMGKVSSEAPQGLDKIIQDMIGQTKTDRSDMVGDLIGTARRIKKTDDDIIDYKNKIIKNMMAGGIDETTARSFAEKMGEEMIRAAGKKVTPKITEQGLLELENIQKNLLTKGRKLQATGGIARMLGE